MAIIKQLNKKSGVTYVYESRSYRDKTTKQPRSKRKLIGRIDEETGEVVPTRRQAKNITTDISSDVDTTSGTNTDISALSALILEKDEMIRSQKAEIAALRKERGRFSAELIRLGEQLKQ